MFHRVKKSSDDKSYMLSNLISHVVSITNDLWLFSEDGIVSVEEKGFRSTSAISQTVTQRLKLITRYRVPGCENCNISVNNGKCCVDLTPLIINISKIALLDTIFGLRFLGSYLTKMLDFRNLSSGSEYIWNKRFYKHDHFLTL